MPECITHFFVSLRPQECLVNNLCAAFEEVWGLTIKLVQQLDIAVENLHLSGCACLLKIAWGAKSDASDSDASASASTAKRSVTKESWYMLGCGSKRPLVHIMGMMDEKCITICSVRKMALVPADKDILGTDGTPRKHWALETSHEASSVSIEHILLFLDLPPYAV